MAEQVLIGIPACAGLAVGPPHIVAAEKPRHRATGTPDQEAAALGAAIGRARSDIQALIARNDDLAGQILEFQEALLDDDEMLAPALAAIAGGAPADDAWTTLMDGEIADYRATDDAYMAARADDLVDLKTRVLGALFGKRERDAGPEPDGAILLADQLTPSAFLEQDWGRLTGAATRGGSPTSHVAILARARGVPLVVGLDADLSAMTPSGPIILDAERGRVVLSPDAETLAGAADRAARLREEDAAAGALATKPAATREGQPITVLMNVDDPANLSALPAATCDGIGLTRTEFLFEGGRLPDEEQQLAVYRRLVDWAQGRPVTIRTLDAGGDKPIAGLTPNDESNPFLGLRGLRLSLTRPDLFKVQLRALARGGADGPVKIMAPMVTIPEEIAELRRLMAETVDALAAEGVAHAVPPIGMMVEVPAAALTADRFDVDFYSIGSNDLIQYTTAVARDNPAVAALARPDNPAVLELITRTVDAARRRGVEVSLCGDMASMPEHIGPLLDTGLRTLSVAPAQIGRAKLAVSRWPEPERQ